MAEQKLRFFARGEALVCDFDAMDRTPVLRRMIGRKFEQVTPGQWGWVPTGKAEEVRARAEVIKACKDGDLWPADEATAAACGVAFDPSYDDASAEQL